MKSRQPLIDVLQVLVRHWGFESVRLALGDLRAKESDTLRTDRGGKIRKKLKPTEMLGRRKLAGSRAWSLQQLAERYESKDFLPTIADVKHFLEVRGIDAGKLKNRDQAFSKVLDVLLRLPEEESVRLRNSAIHARRSELAPIAEAITESARAMRRN